MTRPGRRQERAGNRAHEPSQPARRRPEYRTSDHALATVGSAALLSTQIVARLFAVAFVAVATRELAPTEYSSFAVAANVFAIATLIADFGTSRVVTREVASGLHPAGVLQQTAWIAAVLGAVAGAMVSVYGVAAYGGDTRAATLLVAAAVPAHAVLTSLFGALDGTGRVAMRSALTFALNTSIAIGGLLAILAFGSAFAAVAVMALSPWVVVAATGFLMHRRDLLHVRPTASTQRTFGFLRSSLPFAALSGVAVLYTKFDLLVLSKVVGPVATSNYDAAVRVVEGIAFPSTILASISLVLLARRLGDGAHADAQRLLARIAWAATTGGLVMGGLAFGVAEPLTSLFLGPGFAGSAPLIRILAIQVPLLFVSAVQGAVVGAGHTLRHAVSLGFGLLALMVVADLVAVPRYGAAGAAWTTVAVQSVNVWLYAARNRRVLGLSFGRPRPGALAGASVAAVVGMLLGGRLGVLALLPAASAALSALWLTGGLRREDVTFVARLIRERNDHHGDVIE